MRRYAALLRKVTDESVSEGTITGYCAVHQEGGMDRGHIDRMLSCVAEKLDLTRPLQFDSRAGATWHCIVGRNFGSFVTHGKRLMGFEDNVEEDWEANDW